MADRDAAPSELLREGWLGVPRDWIERVKAGQLTLEQLAILVCTASEANRRERPQPTPIYNTGHTVSLGRGQVLVGARSFAERFGMDKAGRDRVTRALERGADLGVLTKAPATLHPPIHPARHPGTLHPPTLVEFARDREILFPLPGGVATPPPPPPDPIRQETQEPHNHQATATARAEKKRAPLPDALKRVRKRLEQELGSKLHLRDEDRDRVSSTFSEWIATEGEDAVVGACLQLVDERTANGEPTWSLTYLAEAAGRASDAYIGPPNGARRHA